MKKGTAYAIFKTINRRDVSEENKIFAIMEVLDMSTHNGITKHEALEVIRYLVDNYVRWDYVRRKVAEDD